VVECREKALLSHVLGVGSIPQHPIRDRVDSIEISAYQAIEGVEVPCLDSPHQRVLLGGSFAEGGVGAAMIV
jgi:hypothetical protein